MSDQVKPNLVRVSIYIDGFNLYFGMKSKTWQKYLWLDLWAFGGMLATGRDLTAVSYFTADVGGGSAAKTLRQQTYLNALKHHCPDVRIVKGKYLLKPRKCSICGQESNTHEEKMTDVNIATQLVNDAWKDNFDHAIIVSGDSDLVPPITTVKEEFPEKKVYVAFPPNRTSHHLKQTTASFFINQRAFKKSQMPDAVAKSDGSVLTRPTNWS